MSEKPTPGTKKEPDNDPSTESSEDEKPKTSVKYEQINMEMYKKHLIKSNKSNDASVMKVLNSMLKTKNKPIEKPAEITEKAVDSCDDSDSGEDMPPAKPAIKHAHMNMERFEAWNKKVTKKQERRKRYFEVHGKPIPYRPKYIRTYVRGPRKAPTMNTGFQESAYLKLLDYRRAMKLQRKRWFYIDRTMVTRARQGDYLENQRPYNKEYHATKEELGHHSAWEFFDAFYDAKDSGQYSYDAMGDLVVNKVIDYELKNMTKKVENIEIDEDSEKIEEKYFLENVIGMVDFTDDAEMTEWLKMAYDVKIEKNNTVSLRIPKFGQWIPEVRGEDEQLRPIYCDGQFQIPAQYRRIEKLMRIKLGPILNYVMSIIITGHKCIVFLPKIYETEPKYVENIKVFEFLVKFGLIQFLENGEKLSDIAEKHDAIICENGLLCPQLGVLDESMERYYSPWSEIDEKIRESDQLKYADQIEQICLLVRLFNFEGAISQRIRCFFYIMETKSRDMIPNGFRRQDVDMLSDAYIEAENNPDCGPSAIFDSRYV